MLSDWIQLHDTVLLPTADGGKMPLVVYGLGADGISYIARMHGETVGAVYAMAVSGKLSFDNITDALVTLVDEAPIFVATVIAFGAGQPEEIEKASKLPFSIQVEAVEKILRLTFAGDYSPKKVMETVGAPLGLWLQGLSASGSGASGN